MNSKDRVILLVEDNPDDVELTLRAFKKNNISNEVIVVGDGEAALEYLHAQGKYTDSDASVLPSVVLLDLKLPKIDGLEVLKRIRSDERTKTLPVVILTSSKEETDITESYKNGCNSYVQKPVDFDQFMEAARELGLYWLVLNEPPR